MIVKVKEFEREICSWPTNNFEIDHYDSDLNRQYPHTVLMFVPGNPGVSEWYIPMLETVVSELGVGYSCRAVNHAGHGTQPHLVRPKDDECRKLAWSVDGQVDHKIEWIDIVTEEFVGKNGEWKSASQSDGQQHALPRFIFLSHSFGAHLVQRCCVLRQDVLLRSDAIIHLMPFIRFDPIPLWKKKFLSTSANNADLVIPTFQVGSRFAAKLPQRLVDSFLQHGTGMSLDRDREITKLLFTNHEYVQNQLRLGLEEIRTLPERHDIETLRVIGSSCPTFMLYCGGPDQWAPKSHMIELRTRIALGEIPKNITLEYAHNLLHAFVVDPEMIKHATDFVLKSILKSRTKHGGLQSKL